MHLIPSPVARSRLSLLPSVRSRGGPERQRSPAGTRSPRIHDIPHRESVADFPPRLLLGRPPPRTRGGRGWKWIPSRAPPRVPARRGSCSNGQQRLGTPVVLARGMGCQEVAHADTPRRREFGQGGVVRAGAVRAPRAPAGVVRGHGLGTGIPGARRSAGPP